MSKRVTYYKWSTQPTRFRTKWILRDLKLFDQYSTDVRFTSFKLSFITSKHSGQCTLSYTLISHLLLGKRCVYYKQTIISNNRILWWQNFRHFGQFFNKKQFWNAFKCSAIFYIVEIVSHFQTLRKSRILDNFKC